MKSRILSGPWALTTANLVDHLTNSYFEFDLRKVTTPGLADALLALRGRPEPEDVRPGYGDEIEFADEKSTEHVSSPCLGLFTHESRTEEIGSHWPVQPTFPLIYLQRHRVYRLAPLIESNPCAWEASFPTLVRGQNLVQSWGV